MLTERVSRGFYRHSKGDIYFVIGVGVLDEHGHGNAYAPRQVVYESTRSIDDGLIRLRTEAAFVEDVVWPDGETRPRFVRAEYETP